MSNVDTTRVADDDLVQITNMMDFPAGYVVDLTGVRRVLPPHASFRVRAGELRELSYQLGGIDLLQNYIRVCNRSLALEFGIDTDDQIEYNWTQDDVDRCLTKDDIDVLLDALDFAPDGIRQLIVDRAIKLEIPDVNKRKAIKDATGTDVTAAIENRHAYDSEDEEQEKKPARRRRTGSATSAEGTSAPKRRRATKTESATE